MTNAKLERRARSGAWATLLLPVLSVATFLQGCDRSPGNETPTFVREMMKGDLPPDGRIHVTARGELRISPSTVFCTFRPGYGLDTRLLNDELGEIGQKLNNRK